MQVCSKQVWSKQVCKYAVSKYAVSKYASTRACSKQVAGKLYGQQVCSASMLSKYSQQVCSKQACKCAVSKYASMQSASMRLSCTTCQATINYFKHIPLSEQVAEGCHRGTRLSKMRAPSSKTSWLLCSSWLDESIDLSHEVCSTPEGKVRFQAAWLRYKKVLQKGRTAGNHFDPNLRESVRVNRNIRMSRKMFKQTVYRCGPAAHKDWSHAGHLASRGSMVGADRADRPAYVQLRAGYLQSVLKAHEMKKGPGADDGPIVFEVLHTTRRPCLVNDFASKHMTKSNILWYSCFYYLYGIHVY